MGKKNNSVLLIGAFGYHNHQLDGQTIKSRSIRQLCLDYHDGKVGIFETQSLYSNPFLLFKLLWLLMKYDEVIFMPASRSLTYILPFLYYVSKLFRYKLILACIGGFQVEYFKGLGIYKKEHNLQLRLCKNIPAFLPELKRVTNKLIELYHFENIEYFPNFRKFDNSDIVIQKTSASDVLKIAYMARINSKKGYDIVFSFDKYAKENNLNVIIDFYGQIANEDKDDFMNKVNNSTFVSYKKALEPNEIKYTLDEYDLLVLPTRYYNEGIPGTIIDAYVSGLPVVVTEWKNSHEVVDNGVTGFIVPFDDPQNDFNSKLQALAQDREMLFKMRCNALKKSQEYADVSAWNILKKYL